MHLRQYFGKPQRLPLHGVNSSRGWVSQPLGRGNLAPTIESYRRIMDTPHINVNTPDKQHGEVETHIIRSTNYLSSTWRIDKRFAVIVTGYYQPYIQRLSDFRVLSESRLEFRATERVSFNIRLNFRYDSEPPTGVEAHDLEIVNGLSYRF